MKFCTLVGISDIITCANLGDDRLRDLGWRRGAGQILLLCLHICCRPYKQLG